MKKIYFTILIFIIATLLQLLAVLSSYFQIFPSIESFFLSSYVNMRDADNRLEHNEKIDKSDKGYNDIVEYIIEDLQKENPDALHDNYRNRHDELRKLRDNDIVWLKGEGITDDYPGLQPGRGSKIIAVNYHNGEQSFLVFKYAIKDAVEKKRKWDLFRLAFFLFVAGTTISAYNTFKKRQRD